MPLRRGSATVKNLNAKKNTVNVLTQAWGAIPSANVMVAVINKIKIVIIIIIITDILLKGRVHLIQFYFIHLFIHLIFII